LPTAIGLHFGRASSMRNSTAAVKGLSRRKCQLCP